MANFRWLKPSSLNQVSNVTSPSQASKVDFALADLRPNWYRMDFGGWQEAEADQKETFLLQGKKLQEAEKWAEGRQLSDKDNDFLAASRKLEYRVKQERKFWRQHRRQQTEC